MISPKSISNTMFSVTETTIIKVVEIITASMKLMIAARDFLSTFFSQSLNLVIKYLISTAIPVLFFFFFFLSRLIRYNVNLPRKQKAKQNKNKINLSI